MTNEEIEELRNDADGVKIGTYVAKGALHVGNIDRVKYLFPGGTEMLKKIIEIEEGRNNVSVGQLPSTHDRAYMEKLYTNLVQDGFISPLTTASTFFYVMGVSFEPSTKRIVWMKNKQLLREMLQQVFPILFDKSMTFEECKALVATCFENPDGETIILCKPKAEKSIDSDKLAKITK